MILPVPEAAKNFFAKSLPVGLSTVVLFWGWLSVCMFDAV
jgi:hypothetical protein